MIFRRKKKRIITHSGNFHTDDVFAVAALTMAIDEPYEIIRTRDSKIVEKGDFILDVGGVYNPDKNYFDHHQEGGAGERENGIPYSSFGLIWKKYGVSLCGTKDAADIVEKRLCYPVDSADNGIETFKKVSEDVYPYLIHSVTSVFRPTWKEEVDGNNDYTSAFMEYVTFAKKILEREIVHAKDEIDGRSLVVDAYDRAQDKRIIVIDGHYPWENVLSEYPEPLYIVKPDHQNGGSWKVASVRDNPMGFKNRKDLPESWAGKSGKELVKATGVEDAIFCHNKRFIAVAGSYDGALRLAKIAVES